MDAGIRNPFSMLSTIRADFSSETRALSESLLPMPAGPESGESLLTALLFDRVTSERSGLLEKPFPFTGQLGLG